MQSESIDTKDVAKLLRRQLKSRFPRVKFSVRISRYSMGNSIDVRWPDGPTCRQVEDISGQYNGSGFDGSIDLAYGITHWLMPDGSATPAKSQGTTGSRGTHAAFDNPQPSPDARLVRFGSDSVDTSREISDELTERVATVLDAGSVGEEPFPNDWDRAETIQRITRGIDATRDFAVTKRVGWSLGNSQGYGQAAQLVAGCFDVEYAPEPESLSEPQPGEFRVEKHHHTKRGFDFWLVIPATRVDREEFERLRNDAEAAGGWCSRKWGRTPGGFAFKDEADAERFRDGQSKAQSAVGGPATVRPTSSPTVRRVNTDKLRSMADKMDRDAADKLADRLTNTPKRQCQAQSARIDGERLQRAAAYIRAFCGAVESDTLPESLAGIKTTKAVFLDVAKQKMDHVPNGYHSYYVENGTWSDTGEQAEALRALVESSLTDDDREAQQADRVKSDIQRDVDAVRFSKIDGFFPTPESVAREVIDEADIQHDHRVLEPSAGIGSLAELCPNRGNVDCIECVPSLCDILDKKEFATAHCDFETISPSSWNTRYDRIIMNPPFERGQAVRHVQHAYGFLCDGGRMVAIVPNGPQYDKMRPWLEDVGGWSKELPADAFKGKGAFRETGVQTRLVVIDK